MTILQIRSLFSGSVAIVAGIISIAAISCKERDSSSETKLVTGKVVTADLTEFNATVLLTLNESPCTGQHIGNGYVISAAHCFIIAGEGRDPIVQVSSFQGDEIVTLAPTEYTKFIPPALRTVPMVSAGRSYDIPIPDLVIFKPKNTGKSEKMAALNRFHLSKKSLEKAQPDMFVAGYGLVDYDQFDIDGKLRVGAAGISDVMDHAYATFWNREGQWAGGAPGDSGGPLFSVDSHDLTLHGIASNIQRKKDESGRTIKVWTNYTRLDTSNVVEWITGKTGLRYVDVGSGHEPPPVVPVVVPVDPATPPDPAAGLVGHFVCKSAPRSTPYWKIDMNFDDPVFAKVKESRFASETSEVTPASTEWRSDNVVDFGGVVIIVNPAGGRIAFYEDTSKIEKLNDAGSVTAKLDCIRQGN